MSRHLRLAAALLVVLLALAGCDGDDGATVRDLGGSGTGGSGTGSGSGTGVASGSGTEAEECEPGDPTDPALTVTMDEYQILPEEDELTRGPNRFRALNSGKKTHELYVAEARTVEGIPLEENGAVDVEALEEKDRLLGELEGIPSGQSCDLELDLEPGTYVMFCDIRERSGKGVVNHFLQGMRARFKVV